MTSVETTFVLCVEAGPMEQQAMLLVRTLRLWGGRYALSPVMAVKSRPGPDITHDTKRFFDAHQVQYMRVPRTDRFTWDGMLNKSRALAGIEQRVGTATVTWLDTDIIFTGEPEGLSLADHKDFAARPECCGLASQGPGHLNEAYWSTLCRLHDLEPDQMGWVNTWPGGTRVRSYWQGGVFVYRRSLLLGRLHYETYLRHLDARVCSRTAGFFHNDQASLAISVARSGARTQSMDYVLNLNVSPRAPQWATPDRVAAARVIHYHESMWPVHFDFFQKVMAPARAEVRQLIADHGPLKVHMPLPSRVARKVLTVWRNRRRSGFSRGCVAH